MSGDKKPPHPAVTERVKRAETIGVSMRQVLERAKVNGTTWWRNKHHGVEPRLSTLQRIDDALNHFADKKAEEAPRV